MKFTCIDAFSGSGGLALGLIRAGFDLLLSFDSDSDCVKTQLANSKYLPHFCRQADVNSMVGGNLISELNLAPKQLFLLAGGPPCQGFSVQRVGSDIDERNSLVSSYFKLVGELLPKFFLMENVPGIMGKRGDALLSTELQNVRRHGYFIHRKILNAQDFGVPQRRRRLFIIGERNDSSGPFFTFPDAQSSPAPTVRQTIAHLPPPPDNGKDHPQFPNHRADRLSPLNKLRLDALTEGRGREYLPPELLADCHKRSSEVIGHRNVYGRMAWDSVAPTITARFDSFTRGLFGHPEQLRTISLREGALLQTFPEDFEFIGTKVSVARQIGNAVPVALAEALGRQIILSSDPETSENELSVAVA